MRSAHASWAVARGPRSALQLWLAASALLAHTCGSVMHARVVALLAVVLGLGCGPSWEQYESLVRQNEQLRVALARSQHATAASVAPAAAVPGRTQERSVAYNVTVTGVVPCFPVLSEDGRVILGVEVQVENLSPWPLVVGQSARLKDAAGHEYVPYPVGRSACEPRLRMGTHLPPGEKVRGFVQPFIVPPQASRLQLFYQVGSVTDANLEQLVLEVGAAPAVDPMD